MSNSYMRYMTWFNGIQDGSIPPDTPNPEPNPTCGGSVPPLPTSLDDKQVDLDPCTEITTEPSPPKTRGRHTSLTFKVWASSEPDIIWASIVDKVDSVFTVLQEIDQEGPLFNNKGKKKKQI